MNEKHKTYKYKCYKCEYSAPHESYLKEHMNEKHKRYKYKCYKCEYSAPHESDLKEHMNEKHKTYKKSVTSVNTVHPMRVI